MSLKDNEDKEIFLSYLDENNQKREGWVKLVYLDSLIIKFRTNNNFITIPTARILKMKERLKDDK